MDYIWIGIRAFTYVIIFTLIKIIVPKLLGNVKYKNDEMGRTYFSKKKISYFLFVIAVFFTVLLSFLSTIPSNVSGEAKIYLNVGIVIFCLLWYILSIMFDVWYIHLEPTQIIYRNYLGAKKVIKASDIYYFEREKRTTRVVTTWGEYQVWDKLDDIMKQLPELDFSRCHNSFIVHFRYVQELQRDGYLLYNKDFVQISRGYNSKTKEDFLKWSILYM